MPFRNVDGSPETLESRDAQLYSVSYLLTVESVNAGTVKPGAPYGLKGTRQAGTVAATAASESPHKQVGAEIERMGGVSRVVVNRSERSGFWNRGSLRGSQWHPLPLRQRSSAVGA